MKRSAEKEKQRWPVKAVMQQIYEKKLWGGSEYDFFSGIGSHAPQYVKPYVTEVKRFLSSFKEQLVVCDLGCGDFNVGAQLVPSAKNYIAVDVVPELIARNKRQFKLEKLEFCCLDISAGELPLANCVLIRQVMQHLGNEEIEKLIKKLGIYKYLIITEHLPLGSFVPNLNIVSGQGIRLKKNSGVDILKPPFAMKTKFVRQMMMVPYDSKSGIFTNLYQNY